MVREISGDSFDELLYQSLGQLIREGLAVRPRGHETRELESVVLELRDPRDRLTTLPHRGANVFGTIADTLWVLAGRNDLEFPARFVPRLRDYSDDGVTLRGAYGPRLRKWDGVDQLVAAYDRLREDPESRRAVVSLWDPARDATVESKDIPCNNWLQFTVREGRLNLKVVSRSMDIIWGATINVFEWTVLQELVAHWLGTGIGTYWHFIGSLHIYEKHLRRAERILAEPFVRKPKAPLAIAIDLEELDSDLHLAIGAAIGPENGNRPRSPWLSTWASLLRCHVAHRAGDIEREKKSLLGLPDCDVVREARTFLSRAAARASSDPTTEAVD